MSKLQLKLVNSQSSNNLIKEEVTYDDISEVISKWTGIPLSKMLESDKEKLLNLESILHNRIVGQEKAVSAISDSIRRSRSGLQDQNRPVGSFIFGNHWCWKNRIS